MEKLKYDINAMEESRKKIQGTIECLSNIEKILLRELDWKGDGEKRYREKADGLRKMIQEEIEKQTKLSTKLSDSIQNYTQTDRKVKAITGALATEDIFNHK